MSSTVEQQHDSASGREPTSECVSGDVNDKAQSDVLEPCEEIDLASQTANLRLNDENAKPTPASKTAITATHDVASATKTVDENLEPKPEGGPEVSVDKEQDTATGDIGANRIAAGEESIVVGMNDTPRLSTYIGLHNEMMRSKSALTSDATEQLELYHKASHIAHTLLASNEKHGDLPMVMHAHACLVLGCSDEDDCYERMEEAVELIKLAMTEGDLGTPEGETMLKTCEVIMGMREQASPAKGDEETGGNEGEEDEEDGESEPDSESEGEKENERDEQETNDALP